MRFLYVMDPMCGWCYGFRPELEAFLANHSGIAVDWIMGGLAPDATQPMEEGLKQTISSYWHQIEARTQVAFNHDFWMLNTPYRSTYPACRAVISAQKLIEDGAPKMANAIQAAYYQQAKNPSLQNILAECAHTIGLDKTAFLSSLESTETEQELQQHLAISHQLQVSGFPSLFYLDDNNHAHPLALGFCHHKDLEQRFSQLQSK
ncbi:DsbA family protein [Vibrio sonorensis]|uniref:DsbA family protein n=1 Tax=Vibrio sonorensis TaxID=1004316 RepID=UPI0008DB2A91|nr:DsbA family protein [Vibrio sonorensis]